MSTAPAQNLPPVTLPAISALSVAAGKAYLLTEDGELKTLPAGQTQMELHKRPVFVCHAPYTAARLGKNTNFFAYDVLELFAFVHPASFCVPTPAGLAKALGLTPPDSPEDYPFTLMEAAQALLEDLQKQPTKEKGLSPLELAKAMGLQGKGWPWTPYICQALGEEYDPAIPPVFKACMNVWKHLPEWSEDAPPPPPSQHGVTAEEAQDRLAALLGPGAEERAVQMDYTAAMSSIFKPVIPPSPPLTPPLAGGQKTAQQASGGENVGETENSPHLLLAEAGTGTGKTLGYLAPASVWAEKNQGSVWVSTYTKNLQRQIDQELDRLYPDPAHKDTQVTIRKGRENYLCLLNLEDMVLSAALAKNPRQAVVAGILARWAEATRDGDLNSGDFPGWLSSLFDWKDTSGLADRRGECIFSACDHYHKCFVERGIRRAPHARIVVANHALVMTKTASNTPVENLPQRYVFDEGHHLFDAADSAFAAHLTARECQDLRRWLLGPEGGRQSRARGLKKRLEDLIADDAQSMTHLENALHAAHNLPALNWSRRLKDRAPSGSVERFLLLVYQQVHARAEDRDKNGPYSLETHLHPLLPDVPAAAQKLKKDLQEIQKPLRALARALLKKLADQTDSLNSDTRKRLESVSAGIERRCDHMLGAWIAMLEALSPPEAVITPSSPPQAGGHGGEPKFIDWMAVERIEGQAYDVGLYRHYVDPIKPFAAALKPHAHGLAITSATLRDAAEEQEWHVADERTGARLFNENPDYFAAPSPFDYARQTRLFIINDVNKNDMDQLAAAYRTLFTAAGGGALGLFTAIQRLRAVHNRITAPLERDGLPLYAQHIDSMDTGTLVDIFRNDVHACLLGTDAVRDGVDVPGESLRLLAYDRVPWPRPTILHKARRDAFGGRAYDEMVTRLKLRQAFGRLIRSKEDKGVFVMLDSMLPTKLQNAFPEETPIEKCGIADAAHAIREFLAQS